MELSLKPDSPTDEPMFHLLFHHHPLPMWIYDLETLTFLEVNMAAVEKYGYSRDEFLEMTLRDIRPTEDVPRLLADVAQARPLLQYSGQWRHRRKDGTIIDVEITSHILELKGCKAALVMAQDITAHKQAQERLQQAVSAGNVGLWDWDLRTNKVYYSPEWKRQIGYENHEISNDFGEWERRVHPDDLERAKAMINAYLKKPWPNYANEFRLRHKDGSYRWILAQASLRLDEHDQPEHMLGSHIDITERKRAEETLRFSQEQLLSLIEQAPISIAMFDCNMCYLVTSRRWVTEYGRGYQNLIGRPHYEVHPDLPNWWKEVHQRGLAGETLGNDDDLWIQADGSKNWLRWAVLPWHNAQGEIGGIIISAEDITARKQAEAGLRGSEERFRGYFELGLIGMAMISPTKGWLEVNDQICQILGYNRNELFQMTWAEMTHPDDLSLDVAQFNRILAGEIDGYSLDKRFIRKDGQVIDATISVKCLRHPDGSVDYLVGLLQDITARKRAEEQLRLQSAALEATANAILITNREGLIQWVNPAFTQLTGYSLSEAHGKNPRDLLKSDQQNKAIYEELWNTILSGQPWQGELINRRKDGSLYTEEQTITPLRNKSNEITHFIAIKQDITTRKHLEAENEQLTAQFYQAQKMDSIGQLAGGIAHDFNNMLVPIVGYAELGQMGLPQESKLRADLGRIKDAANRAASLTRQILAFSRHQVLEMKPLDLNQVISEFEPMLRRLIGEDIALKTHLAANLPPIKADKGQLEQVLLNLVVNARDAMPGGGRLTIETANVVLDQAYVTRHLGAQPGPHALLAISDTGHGMDAATQQRIFEPFFTTKAKGQGTGLGLATVFGIVKQHEGNIWVYSEPGRGTTFKIYLPLAQAVISSAQTKPLQVGSLDGMETVLVVEDEASVRQLVSDTLRAHGYQVLAAGDPAEGLKLTTAHQGTIHLLLTDVIMPVMNGAELYRQLVMERPDLKVLYMSGYTDNVIAHYHVLDEEVAFLQKPFSIQGLLQKVRTVLG